MGQQTTSKKEDKKPAAPTAEKPGASAPQPQSSSKNSSGAKVGCHAFGCKDKDERANFCQEHFRQYKFGLITKTGEKVLDYERKFEHYHNYLRSHKVA